MKINYITLALLVLVTSLYAQTTYVPDDTLENWFETHYYRPAFGDNGFCDVGDSRSYGDGIAGNNLVRTNKLEGTYALNFGNTRIFNFTGLEACINLERLWFESGNSSTDLDPTIILNLLSHLKLWELRISNINNSRLAINT